MLNVRPVEYEQTTPSAEWIVVHNLNRRPSFDVIVELNGKLIPISPMESTCPDANTTIIKFSRPFTGRVRFQ